MDLKRWFVVLDVVYLKDQTTQTFCAIKSFVEFHREGEQSFLKFLVEFKNRYREVKKYELSFEDDALDYFLLVAVNL